MFKTFRYLFCCVADVISEYRTAHFSELYSKNKQPILSKRGVSRGRAHVGDGVGDEKRRDLLMPLLHEIFDAVLEHRQAAHAAANQHSCVRIFWRKSRDGKEIYLQLHAGALRRNKMAYCGLIASEMTRRHVQVYERPRSRARTPILKLPRSRALGAFQTRDARNHAPTCRR